jgi:hypothetical protein
MSGADRLAALPCDALGVSGSAVCLVHCIAMPLLLARSPAPSWLDGEAVEWALLCGCLVFGAVSLPFGWFRCHRCPHSLVLYAAGVAALAAGRVASFESVEAWLTPAGATLVAVAHVWNRRLSGCAPWRLCRVPPAVVALFTAASRRRPSGRASAGGGSSPAGG